MSNYYGSSSGHRDGFGLFSNNDAWNQATVFEESKVEEFEVAPAESIVWNDSEFEAVPAESAVGKNTDDDEENEIVFSVNGIMNVPTESESFFPSPPKNGKEVPTNPPKKKKGSRKDDDGHGRLLETEEWGQISRKELLVVLFLLVFIIAAAITVVVVFVVGGGDADTARSDTSKSDPTPIPEYVLLGSQEKLDILRTLIARNEVAAEYLDILPEFAVALEGKLVDDTAEAIVRAASWVVHEDQFNIPRQIVDRFALATIFFANGGDSWTNSSGWLSNESICDGWYGISCYFSSEKIEEIDLSSNNLQGEIPEVLTLLTDVRVLWLNDNALVGSIPGEIVGSMPLLVILYMQGNQLTGRIPTAVKNNGVLHTLFLQRNNLTGSWPEAFCPPCPDCNHPFNEFGLDCSEISCSPECCKSSENCF